MTTKEVTDLTGMRPTVAVVDDDRDVRQALNDALTSAGFAVQLAPHALKLVSALEVDRPAVIVLDVVNSWIDGLGLCRALKRNQEYKEIPIVILSGKSEPESIRAAFQAGAAAYFVKPLDVSRLVARIVELTYPAASAGGDAADASSAGISRAPPERRP
jgi:DNA-binding response OmpR family regulator